ncbi:hypothetical protein FBU30_000147 [Linnemannia zychae]|nr:hypothetical protein FBU30_000147 [Linnemannia zychae]
MTNDRNGAPGSNPQKIGKLEQNSAFKDNAFLLHARTSGALLTPTHVITGTTGARVGTPYRSNQSSSASNNNNQVPSTSGSTMVTTIAKANTNVNTGVAAAAPSHSKNRLQPIKESEQAADAVAKLREATKKANAQLPSDDEGSDASDSEDSDYEPGFKKQQKLLAQQQYQHQLFLEQQQILLQEMTGMHGRSAGIDFQEQEEEKEEEEVEKKPVEINHEAVINRMKDRHRALLQGAAAAAREEYFEDFRDEHGMIPPPVLSPGAMMAYNMQYGMDPSMVYGSGLIHPDEYRFQQQQHQMYFTQIPTHSHINASTYNHPSMNGIISNYGYAPMPSGYSSGMQTSGYQGHGTPIHHLPGVVQQSRSNSLGSDSTAPSSLSRRGSVQYSVMSSARLSEDSWNESHQQHFLSTLSTQRSASSDSGCSGIVSDQGKNVFEDSSEDAQTTVGSDYEKSKTKIDDVTDFIENLSISRVTKRDLSSDDESDDDSQSSDDESDDDSQSSDDERSQESDSDLDENLESLKNNTAFRSLGHRRFKDSTSVASSNSSRENADKNEDEDENNSSGDDQPIILSRRDSARSPFLSAKTINEEVPAIATTQATVLSQQQQQQQQSQQSQQSQVQSLQQLSVNNGQMQYIPTHTMNMYPQPIQAPMHMSYMTSQQQQAPQQIMSPPQVVSTPQILSPPQSQQSQQQAYISMGYQFPGPPPPAPSSMGHHHSYSVDRISMPTQTFVSNSAASARRTGPAPSKSHVSTGSFGSAIQLQYPIPATTLLHPLPRRSQSVRVRPQGISPVNSNSNLTSQNGAGRGRSSMDFKRLPSGGYQSMMGGPICGPEFNNANNVGPYIRGFQEPLSPPPQQQQQQQASQIQQLPPHLQKQMHQQQIIDKQGGFYMSNLGPVQYGYLMQAAGGVSLPDPYSTQPQQQVVQAGRR